MEQHGRRGGKLQRNQSAREACLGFDPASETDIRKEEDRKEDSAHTTREALQAAGFLLLMGQAREKDLTVFSHQSAGAVADANVLISNH